MKHPPRNSSYCLRNSSSVKANNISTATSNRTTSVQLITPQSQSNERVAIKAASILSVSKKQRNQESSVESIGNPSVLTRCLKQIIDQAE